MKDEPVSSVLSWWTSTFLFLKSCWRNRNTCINKLRKVHVDQNDENEIGEEQEADYAFIYSNAQVQQILKALPLRNVIYS